MADFKFVKNGYVFAYSSIIISKIAKWAVFSKSRDLVRYLKKQVVSGAQFSFKANVNIKTRPHFLFAIYLMQNEWIKKNVYK